MNTQASSSSPSLSSSTSASSKAHKTTTATTTSQAITNNNHQPHNNLSQTARLRVWKSSTLNQAATSVVTSSTPPLSNNPKYHSLANHHRTLVVGGNNTSTVYHNSGEQDNDQEEEVDGRGNSNCIALYEMPKLKKKAEAEPLLASPMHDSGMTSTSMTYNTDNLADDDANQPKFANDSVNILVDIEKGESSKGVRHGRSTTTTRQKRNKATNASMDTESIESFADDDDTTLLHNIKPVITRVQMKNVYLLNVCAFLFVALNMTLNLTVLAVIHERVPMDQPHLPDVLFDLLPDRRHFLDITEYFIICQSVSLSVVCFFHRYRSVVFRRFCIIMGVIYFFRAICMASTQLPLASRNYTCAPQLKNSSETANISSLQFVGIIMARVFQMSLGMGLSINGHHNYCGDYIFSGHTIILVLSYLFLRQYFFPSTIRSLFWRCLQLALLLMTFFCIVCVVIARGHYFIDIIIAYLITTRTFWIYHTLCTSNPSNYKAISSYFHQLWWWQIFVYFENARFSPRHSNVKVEDIQQVQRIFEWPLPWPKSFAPRKHRSPQFEA